MSRWGPKSSDFAAWQDLAASGCLRVIETDAAKNHGWSYHLCGCGKVVSGTWPADFPEQADNAEHINFKVLWVAREVLRREPEWLRGWRVVIRIDNMAAVHYVKFRFGRVLSLQNLAGSFEEAERSAGCWCMAVYMQGSANVVSDEGSRDVSFAERWNKYVFRDATLKQSIMTDILRKF